jgi:hypothetical protein
MLVTRFYFAVAAFERGQHAISWGPVYLNRRWLHLSKNVWAKVGWMTWATMIPRAPAWSSTIPPPLP